ncbi:VOC family protein [Nocardia mexicana]|uniref:Glyoxalase/bleomycin resistance protein/dioxygenase superfamily protein n=1 Tax=Nocardia mexicana TaxID=279262 RepID=A0A370H969_9NOCA|nr:VOC family protein [Nocardia mexicana]RDI52770.1 glyoxalase/bleomycin resistance protein/dioxygenase superfamily protein [Nocardia mexicana]
MTGLYHVCFAVPELERAMADMTASVGMGWREIRRDRVGEWDFRIVFSAGDPPYVELIEAGPGSPWDPSAGPHFHHLGFWTTSITAGSGRLERQGFPVDFSGCPYGRSFAYHRVDSIGARIELVDAARQPDFLDGLPMPAIPED